DLLSFRPIAEIERLRAETRAGKNPRDIKYILAREIVGRFHGGQNAERAHETFVEVHRNKGLPEDIPLTQIDAAQAAVNLPQLLKQAGLVPSTSEANRLIDQGA